MIGSAAAWRRMLKLWLPGLILLIVNLAVLSTYRFLLAGQTQLRASRVERLTKELSELQEYRGALEEVQHQTEVNRQRVEEFYGTWLSSEADRLTQAIAEVKRLSRSAGVRTSGFQYPGEALEDFGLVRRSIVFSVEGSYKQLRRFIYSLERSDQFLILDEVAANDRADEGTDLRVRLRISTLFTEESEGGEA